MSGFRDQGSPVFFLLLSGVGAWDGFRVLGLSVGGLLVRGFMVLRAPGYGFRVEGLGFKV